ncbi:MAG: leucine-rich repeat protein [Dorea sp.]
MWFCRDEIEGETVTALDDYAFARNLEVEEIWLPEDLKEVGRYVFYRCRNLKKLILENQLLDMGGGALTGVVWKK